LTLPITLYGRPGIGEAGRQIRVFSLKGSCAVFEFIAKATAGLSTPFAAKSATNLALDEQKDWLRWFVNKISELASAARKSQVGKLAAVHS
jgi:hypothetical protein